MRQMHHHLVGLNTLAARRVQLGTTSTGLLGIHGIPPIVSSRCFRVNLTANQRGDYERMRCRHQLIIQIFAAFSEIFALTVSSRGRFAARFTGNFAYVLSTMAHRGHGTFPKFGAHKIRLLHTKSKITYKFTFHAQIQRCCTQI